MIRSGSLILFSSIIIALYSWWPQITRTWEALNSIKDPIYIPNAEAHWVNDYQFDIVAPTYYWNDTCPTVWVQWAVLTRENGAVPVTTQAVSGPFADKGELPPRYKISIEKKVGPPIQLRATIPGWLDRGEVLMVAVEDIVPDNEPCVSGWSGVMRVFRLQIKGS